MLLFPHAKINLGLNVVRKRTDGFHDIETVMVPIPLTDALEVIRDGSVPNGEAHYDRTGLQIPGTKEEDLCFKAFRAISKVKAIPGIRMHLHKSIPLGGGLGGGSSDGAHALSAINTCIGAGLANEQLAELSLDLGSDCPSFLHHGIQLSTGRGEVLRTIDLDLSGLWLLLVNPSVHVPTTEVYHNTRPSGRSVDLERELIDHPLEEWRSRAPNMMEEYVAVRYPEVGAALKKMEELGAPHFAMSGSGATIFGLFRERPRKMDWPADHRTWLLRL
ncbi:MAG: 4-(cytidine 5'-diphospho)-2-C-methyl-D-erythritol kinase [Flavobacteriales bacterium]|nr:4-(cytidine 5'-diphospho)-2-C-methyl-D-erythritol kinase [Flavobacteriales bacterium]